MQKVWKSVKIWQSYREYKGGNFFFETQCIYDNCQLLKHTEGCGLDSTNNDKDAEDDNDKTACVAPCDLVVSPGDDQKQKQY